MTEPRLKLVKPTTPEERKIRQTMEVMVITPDIVSGWVKPPFQRDLKENTKVVDLAADVTRDGGVIPGVITLGVLDGTHYIIDGQHRCRSFILSGCAEGLANIRICYFSSMAEMGAEFVKANSALSRMTPDDLIRGMEDSSPALGALRKACPWLGYSNIRRNEKSPIASMSLVLRCWFGSATEAPSVGGLTATETVLTFNTEESEPLAQFLKIAMTAWGKDKEHARLWGTLNLSICMWLYRRMVVTAYSARTVKLERTQFTNCLMAVAADAHYSAWLVGRQLRERDRSPAYKRIRDVFAARIQLDTGKKPAMPSPTWFTSSGGSGKK